MTIRGVKSGDAFSEFERRANGQFTRQLEEVKDVMEDVMKRGAENAKSIMRTSGVENTLATGGQRGSGNMIDAVDYEVRRRGDTIIGRFGWLPGAGRKDYYGWQESGTLGHGQPAGMPSPVPGTNRGIKPMLAIHQANREAQGELASRLGRGNRRG